MNGTHPSRVQEPGASTPEIRMDSPTKTTRFLSGRGFLTRVATGLVLVTILVGCGEGADPAGSQPPPDPDVVAQQQVEAAKNQRFGQVFERVLPLLEGALGRQDRHDALPEKRLTWAEDQQSNRREIDRLLGRALDVLNTSLAQEVREQIRDLDAEVRAGQQRIIDFSRERVSAPTRAAQGVMEKVNPFVRTKEDLDTLIEDEQLKIEDRRASIENVKQELQLELQGLGLVVGREEVDVLLDSVTGDDQITLAVVFDNIRQMAVQLEEITVRSGEELTMAHRYYGLYVVLLQVMDLSQRRVMQAIDQQYIPRLHELSEQASKNMDEAARLIASGQGDSRILRENIRSNSLTSDVIALYVDHLGEHRRMVAGENAELHKLINTSQNTYETVKLSANVAELIQAAKRDLQAMSRMQVPPLRGFQNEEMRREFLRLTEALAIP